MRKQISLRLSDAAIERLDELVEETGLSSARIVERMLLADDEPIDRTAYVESQRAVMHEQRKQSARSESRSTASKPPVQDISSTKKVRPGRLEHPIRTTTTGKPEQGKTTLTGRPFGPVPK